MLKTKNKSLQYPSYSAYKDSGVEWIGEIPEEWGVERLGNLGFFSASGIDKYLKSSETKVKIINFTDIYGNIDKIIDSSFNFMIVTTPEENRKKHLVKKGDLIFLPSSETYEDLGLSALVNENLENVSFSYHVIRLRFIKEIVHNYKKYLTNNSIVLNQFSRAGKGTTRKILNRLVFKNIQCIIPPLSEQQAIADFLDAKTAKIDLAIAKKQKLIVLLKERKQIMIQQAVTQGLNPAVPMKDSGVEWIGKIPEHWEVKKLKYILFLSNKKSITKDSNMTYIGMENIESKTGKYIQSSVEVEGLANKFDKGDILFGKLRPYLAKIYLADFSGLCSTEFLVYKVEYPDYFKYLLLSDSFIDLVDSSTYGAKMPRANADWINNQSIPLPPLSEQKEIATYIETQSEKTDSVIALQQRQIERLKEYKSVLIDAAVTGKIKVN